MQSVTEYGEPVSETDSFATLRMKSSLGVPGNILGQEFDVNHTKV